MRSKRNRGILVLTTCMSLVVMSTGCRSGKSMNMFSLRGEPSPEALAGSGPTTTYPVPPSESATPEAIASVAGGTGASPTSPVTTPAGPASRTAQVAGLDIKPGYITPASTNLSAAQANGFPGGTRAVGFQAPSTTPPALEGIVPPQVTAPKTTSGYQFGTNPAAQSSGASTYTIPSSYSAPKTTPGAATPPAVTNAGGFTLPSDLAGAVAPAAAAGDCTDCDGCKACEGASPSPTITATTPSSESYSPGSTAGASSYPASGSTYLR